MYMCVCVCERERCANHFRNSEQKGVLAIRVLSILILVSSLTGHDRILVTYFSLPLHHYSFYFFLKGGGGVLATVTNRMSLPLSQPQCYPFQQFLCPVAYH